MNRFFHPDAAREWGSGTGAVNLAGGEAHHASRVLRLQVGERVEVLDGRGGVGFGRIDFVSKSQVRVMVESVRLHEVRKRVVEMYVGVPKGSGMEDVVEKLTELGVSRVVPLLTERTNVHYTEESAIQKREKWELTAVAALKQCGNPWLPVIEKPVGMKEMLSRERVSSSLVMSLEEGCREVGEWFRESVGAGEGWVQDRVGVFVGPEGDFSPGELEMLKGKGVRALTLGPWVLRVGTAAVTAAALVLHEMRLSASSDRGV